MIISMRPHATKEEIDHVCERIREFGYKVHSIEGEQRVVIGVVGMGDVTACLESLEATPGVESAVRISAPYKFVSKEFKKEHTAMRINGVEIGRRRVRRDGRPLFGGIREADHGDGGRRGHGRRQDAARRRLQAAHVALRFPGPGRAGAQAAAQGQGSHRPGHRHRSHERPRRGAGGRIRRRDAGGRAQHAELRAAQDAGHAAAGPCC